MTLEDLRKLRDKSINDLEMKNTDKDIRVVVGMATCGISAGAGQVLTALDEEIKKRNLKNINVVQTGCIGMCSYEPIVEICTRNNEKVTYIQVNAEKAKRIVAEHLVNRNIIKEYTIESVE